MEAIFKYPRTRHLEGSRLQPGDEDLNTVSCNEIAGKYIVVEEKVDGANAGLSFSADGELRLQSRGHYLTGGGRERHFSMFKTWAISHKQTLWQKLADRYIVFGEWLYAKHPIFYDRLPHYFLEFDVFDKEKDILLTTQARRILLDGLPIVSVRKLFSGRAESREHLESMIKHSSYKSYDWLGSLRLSCVTTGLDPERIISETEPSHLMEGLYIKVETQDRVARRCKWVRTDFLTKVLDVQTHWLDRPILPNRLAPDVDIFKWKT